MVTLSHSDVLGSAIGAFLGFALLISWIIVFQVCRVEWGAFADQISFTFPIG
jgi:hypothetical protein